MWVGVGILEKMDLRTQWDHNAILYLSFNHQERKNPVDIEYAGQSQSSANSDNTALICHICTDREEDSPGTWHPDLLMTLRMMGDKLRKSLSSSLQTDNHGAPRDQRHRVWMQMK